MINVCKYLLFISFFHQLTNSTKIHIPISLNGQSHSFNVPNYCELSSSESTKENSLRQSIREFCIIHFIRVFDCNQIMKEAESITVNITCNEDTKKKKQRERIEPTKILTWSSDKNDDSDDDNIYIQLISATVLDHLSPITAKRLKLNFNSDHVIQNQFGRKSKTWHFAINSTHFNSNQQQLHRRNSRTSFLLDNIFGSYEHTNIFTVVPNDPGAIPWSPQNPRRSTLVLLFDGNNPPNESIQQYLQRCSDLLDLIQHHLINQQMDLGLIVLGDQQGLFPTSLYNQVHWSMRQYYFSDHVINRKTSPLWLPLGPLFEEEK